MADSPSIEQRLGRRVGRAIRGLGPNERLAATGVLAIGASLFLPWYGAPIRSDLVQTGFGAFSFATAALLLAAAAVLFLCTEVGGGYRPPRPLSIGALLIVGGAWCGLILLYLMLDTPHFAFRGVEDSYDVRYGLLVALGGAATITIAGFRRRATEYVGRIRHSDDDLDEIELDEGEDEEDG